MAVIIVVICYCRARRKRSRRPYCETVPVRYEREGGTGEGDKIIINVGKNNEKEEAKASLSDQRKKDIVKLIAPKTTGKAKVLNKENRWGSNAYSTSKL